jgi:hypothetical protein
MSLCSGRNGRSCTLPRKTDIEFSDGLTRYEFASAVLLAKLAWKSSQAISLQVATGLELPPECGPPTGNDLSRNFRTAAIQHGAIFSTSTRCWCLVMVGGSWAYHANNPTFRDPPKTPSLELTVEHWAETTAASQKGVAIRCGCGVSAQPKNMGWAGADVAQTTCPHAISATFVCFTG